VSRSTTTTRAARHYAGASANVGFLGTLDDGVLLGQHAPASASAMVLAIADNAEPYPPLAFRELPGLARERSRRLGLPDG